MYDCNKCDLTSAQKTNLKQHIKLIHEGVKNGCYQCDYRGTQQGNLITHQHLVHRELSMTVTNVI